jgi:hypothetical protein
MADASPEAVIHQVTALPARLDWSNPNLFDVSNRARTEGTRVLIDAEAAGPRYASWREGCGASVA